MKIAVFTGNLAFSVRKGIAEIDKVIPGLQWLVIEHSPSRRPAQLLKNQWSNFKRNGWRWIPYQAGDILQRLAPSSKSTAPPKPRPGAEFGTAALRSRPNFTFLKVGDIHAESTLEAVRQFAPDLGLSLAAPILRAELFDLPRKGTLNLHKGRVPDYRGMPPAFWELWNGEDSVGCTVHWVAEKLDAGDVAGETVVRRAPFSTLRGLQLKLDETGVDLMREAVQQVVAEQRPARPQPAGGATYRKPTLSQVAELERKLRGLQPPSPPLTRRLAKAAITSGGFRAWQLGMSHMLAPRITVLLYHRVTDDVRDNLSVGIEQFDRQLALLSRHCQVLSIDEVLDSSTVKASGKPQVCITFDDGYLDNYTHAAQILLRHQLPAAFFVSTGLIGSDRRFPHDTKRGNDFIPLMDWDHLGRMHGYGFTIGSHTVNHIDCAAEPEEVVLRELADSRDALHERLGLRETILAYPYGKRSNMTPERLEMVKQAGYRGCLSAYGGANIGSVDRFNVLRRGIHWEFSDEAFLFAALGL